MAAQLFLMPLPIHRTIMFGAPAIALWRGPTRARIVGATWAILYAFEVAFPAHWVSGRPEAVGWRSLSDDLVVLAVCLACLRGARRYWIIWAAAFALLSVCTDLLYILFRNVTAFAFLSADYIWGYGLCAALVWAAFSRSGRSEART